MKNKSIKLKLTVWFALSMMLIIGITMVSVISICSAVIKKNTFENLVEVIESNFDEIEYFDSFDSLYIDDDHDIYFKYHDGYLEIDDDFVRYVNGIECSVFEPDGSVLYGEDILRKLDGTSVFGGESVKTVKDGSKRFYYCDKKIILSNGEELWLRGVVSADYGMTSVNNIIRLSLCVLPLLLLAASLGGYSAVKKSLSPINEIAASAELIKEGDDLTRRIQIRDKSREIVSLSDSFNGMLSRLEASFKSQQQLTSDASHELRTPVSVIMAQCEFILDREDCTSEEYNEAMRLILRQSRRMSSMINDMLYFSRLERKKEKEGLSSIDLSATVRYVCDDMALIRDKDIELSSEIDSGITIDGDTELISRLVANLISNAYRYGRKNGRIYVALENSGDKAVLSVRDNGIGISEEDIAKIWNRFYRADKSRSEKGNGLGLNFVHEIARIHGAEVKVQSILGQGSEFKVIFDLP